MCGLKQHDKSIADLNPALLKLKKNKAKTQQLSPKPIGYINKTNPVVRVLKTIKLYFTTMYSWSISWHQAAR